MSATYTQGRSKNAYGIMYSKLLPRADAVAPSRLFLASMVRKADGYNLTSTSTSSAGSDRTRTSVRQRLGS